MCTRYIILQLLCEGGQARLWTAIPRGDAKTCVVIKQYDFDAKRSDNISDMSNHSNLSDLSHLSQLQRFKYEVKLLQLLKQENVPHMVHCLHSSYDAHTQYGYMISPYIDVPANSDLFLSQLTPYELLNGMKRITECLDHIHRCGVVHGDVKPRNVLWDRVWRNSFLIDFGSSQFYFPQLEMEPTGRHIGIPCA